MTERDKNLDQDPLADAPLTATQRQAWETLRAELAFARARLQETESRLLKLEGLAAETAGGGIVLSRPEFNREVARMLAFDERYGGASSVLYYDLTGLARLEEVLGRAFYDRLSQAIGETMAKNVRGCDIVGRLAPEEFGILLARCDNFSAWRKAEMISQALRPLLSSFEGHLLDLEAAYGAYTFSEQKSSVEGIRAAAAQLAADRRQRGSN